MSVARAISHHHLSTPPNFMNKVETLFFKLFRNIDTLLLQLIKILNSLESRAFLHWAGGEILESLILECNKVEQTTSPATICLLKHVKWPQIFDKLCDKFSGHPLTLCQVSYLITPWLFKLKIIWLGKRVAADWSKKSLLDKLFQRRKWLVRIFLKDCGTCMDIRILMRIVAHLIFPGILHGVINFFLGKTQPSNVKSCA